MGLFLALNSIIGKSAADVAGSLDKFARKSGSKLEPVDSAPEAGQACSILESNGNTTVLFPDHFMQWDDAAAFLSEDLHTPVFSFHIHDGDLWMYVLYVDGKDADQFNPIPEYWDDTIGQEEMDLWKGDAETLAIYLPHIQAETIVNYLVHWDEDMDTTKKAYPDDEYHFEDQQLFDFMRRLQLPVPFNDHFEPLGNIYLLHMNEDAEDMSSSGQGHAADTSIPDPGGKKKPWWKFWMLFF